MAWMTSLLWYDLEKAKKYTRRLRGTYRPTMVLDLMMILSGIVLQ